MIHFKAKALLRFTTFSLTALAFILLNVNGCQPQKQAGPPEKITIAYSTAFNAVLVHIAFAKDYFAQEALDTTLQPHAFGKEALHRLFFLVFHNPHPLLITP